MKNVFASDTELIIQFFGIVLIYFTFFSYLSQFVINLSVYVESTNTLESHNLSMYNEFTYYDTGSLP